MPDYVLNRTYTLRSTQGHIINFVKGQPVYVPPVMEREVTLIGAEPVDGPRIDLLDDEPAALPEVPGGADREAVILAAFEQLEARNARGDFTGQGRPSIPVLEKLLGFEVISRERDELWERHTAARAA